MAKWFTDPRQALSARELAEGLRIVAGRVAGQDGKGGNKRMSPGSGRAAGLVPRCPFQRLRQACCRLASRCGTAAVNNSSAPVRVSFHNGCTALAVLAARP
jgi:hypothetical protein